MTQFKNSFLTAILAPATALILSCSSGGDNGNDDGNSAAVSSSSLDIEKSSSSQNANISSSSSEQSKSSSSSVQTGNGCATLNNNMAVQMNLNGEPVVVTKNGSALVEGVNYEVIETQNSIKVNGLEDYIGSVERANSGSGIVVKDGSKVLTENTDYAIVVVGNSVKIVGINSYSGSVEVELPCEPEPPIIEPGEGLMYWGHIPSAGKETFADYIDWYLETEMSGLGLGHKYIESGSITGTVKEIQFHAGTGYRVILIPQSAGVPARIDDAIGNNVKETAFVPVSNITIKGMPYYLFISDVSGTDSGNVVVTIKW